MWLLRSLSSGNNNKQGGGGTSVSVQNETTTTTNPYTSTTQSSPSSNHSTSERKSKNSVLEFHGSDKQEIDTLMQELSSKSMSSPLIRALISLYSKNNGFINAVEQDQKSDNKKLAQLETQFVDLMKERKILLNAHPELMEQYSVAKSTQMSTEEDDGEDMYAYIQKKNLIDQELKKVQSHIKASKTTYCHYFCDGELEFMKQNMNSKDTCKYYTITYNPTFDPFTCPGEFFHFRLAETFINRASGNQYTLREVTYVCNPFNLKRFNERKRELAKKHGFLLDSMKPLILFHGNRLETNYDNIMKTNFSMQRIGSNTGNLGYYGKGVYFSSYPQYSIGYAGSNCLLVCLVFTGKSYPLKQIVMGCPKEPGYDSHTSPDGFSEVVIFDEDQILPIYKVKF
ncbi:hypothetical protein C9374_006140 [Naegleria lovaniensis]|uniref:PARP catalytic domain-containing protein n=1 Tax=Naegleria lovaniensis TaxID=51637 RepID=A0AA88KMR6_NAELO|nr:uncharacterized protein C9374_006140 [Naegleria lovaniensis]KAG2381756.1 hypothetical protein C9374_006140 [Naegleria lovaniensis]